MTLIALLLLAAIVVSARRVRLAAPAESLLAVSLAGAVCLVLFQAGRLT